jgi:lipid-A-disaccharide synthase
MVKILVSSLEPSANLHLKEILSNIEDEYELYGIFDKDLQSTPPLYDSRDFSVMGIIDIIPKILKAKEAIKELVFMAQNVDKIILIDAPAFNISLLKELKKAYPNKEVIYYILPKVWAWKKKRAKIIDSLVDYPISIFPFEDKFYKKPLYYGNPLLDEIREYKTNVTKDIKTVAFLAGSRKSEIKSLMPVIKELQNSLSDKKSILVIPKHFSKQDIANYYGDISNFEVIYDTHFALNKSDFAFVCSGTATLEASLIGVPFVLMYKAKKIDYFIAKRFVKIKYVGLANIILDFANKEPLHPEVLQDDVNVANLLNIYYNYNYDKFFENVLVLREQLKGGCSKKIADILMNKEDK